MCAKLFYIFLIITFVSSPAITIRILNEFTCRGLNSVEEFKCGNSTICIGIEYQCDGIQDCPDASDEVYCPNSKFDFWLKAPGVSRIKRQSTCRNDQWRCSDGSCISLDYICDGVDHCVDRGDETNALCRRLTSVKTGGCILPPYPAHGTYKVSKFPNAQPGQDLASFVLTVSCRRGFGVVDPNGGDGSTTQQLTCINGDYQYKSVPKCVRFCRLDPHPSVRYMCHVPGVGFKTCKKYVPPGTSVNPICNKPIYKSIETLRYMQCTSGFWNYVAECPADCGRVTIKNTPLVIDGQNVKRGELPWHAAVYRKNDTSYTQICGGTLIANNVVLSAAHCFWKHKKLQPSTSFSVSIGKIYREWDSENDVGAQKSDIKEIKIPQLFKGPLNNYQQDIAMLVLTTPFVYMPFIRPVCLYYDAEFERQQLREGQSGKVAGWGLTSASGPAADILQTIQMPFIHEDKCIEDLPEDFTENITGDKFCAGHTTGKALCHGDSGGGLAFPDKGLGVNKYYLRGIVSVAPPPDEISLECNDKVYTVFTKISAHRDFIERELAASAVTKCPLYAFQCDDGSCEDLGVDCNGRKDCADGSDEADELCKPGAEPETDREEVPPLVPSTGTEPTPSRPSTLLPQEEPPIERRCVAPEVPKYSTYESSIPNIRPGESFDSLTLTVTCRQGYKIQDSEHGVVKNSTDLVCYLGWWDKEMPECVRYCKLERDPSVEYRCRTPNTTNLVECDEYINTGTSVLVNCNTHYYYFSEVDLTEMKCIDGTWNYIARCKAECGRVIQDKIKLEIGWDLAKRGELPWHAGVYYKKTKPVKLYCGGSLISNTVVLTAAHCVWSQSLEKVQPASDYAIAVGKIHRDWDDVDEADVQKSDVKDIKVPSLFHGTATNFQEDIAIVVVITPFVYQTYVRPVCLNFDTEFEKRQLMPGNLGKVAGWGLIDAQGTPTRKLKVVKMPYIASDTCIRSFPPAFVQYFTSDKFCAGYTNGTSLCQGDSGGGLAFPNDEFGIDRYYLRGISSTAPVLDDDSRCNTHTYNLFTQIKKHEEFIKEYL